MDWVIGGLSEHGYLVLCAVVFSEAIGLPFPAALALLVAGAASARHLLHPFIALAAALSTMMVADTLMFLLGRRTGWWLLGLLCRLSLNPESCILRSADAFYKRGRWLLLFAKFIPGVNTLAPPLAGSMNMPFVSFIRLDVLGAALYVSAYFTVGYLFSDVLGAITAGYQTLGRVVSIILAVAIVFYLIGLAWTWIRSRALLRVPMAEPVEVSQQVAVNGAVVYDVRSHGYFDSKAQRIEGSRRLDPNILRQMSEELPHDRPVYLYCTCLGDATSTRVARELIDKGVQAIVIKGGLRQWKRRGLPVEGVPEEEVALMPTFSR
jgi:membrane protein DedA with SNARE-associated domain/rhodanese-related sulfurtransferase